MEEPLLRQGKNFNDILDKSFYDEIYEDVHFYVYKCGPDLLSRKAILNSITGTYGNKFCKYFSKQIAFEFCHDKINFNYISLNMRCSDNYMVLSINNNNIEGFCIFTYRDKSLHLKLNRRRSCAPVDNDNIELNKILHIHILCIKHRRMGNGKKFIMYMKNTALQNNCDAISLNSVYHHSDRFYRSLNFKRTRNLDIFRQK